MERSDAVREGLAAWYAAFNSHDADRFAAALAGGGGVSVIGSAPGEGHANRESWIAAYRDGIAAAGLRMEPGGVAAGWAAGDAGYATDTPAFVLPNGARLPTRLTAVLAREDGAFRVAHLHFSVGVPDEDAIQPPD